MLEEISFTMVPVTGARRARGRHAPVARTSILLSAEGHARRLPGRDQP